MQSRKSDFDSEEKLFVANVKLPLCPPMEMLRASLEGVLPEEQSLKMNAHLASCEVCRTLLEDLDAIDFGSPTSSDAASIRERITHGDLRAFASAVPSPSWLRRRWWVPAFALAACALVAALIVRPSQKPPVTTRVEIAQAKPIPEMPIDKLPIHVDPAAVLATRGAGSADQPSGSELVKGLSRYQNNDYEGAAQQLKALSQKYPDDPTVRLYLGVSELLLGNTDLAAGDLARAKDLNHGERQADAAWYLGIAQLRLKNPTSAAPIFHDLCLGKSSYSQRACTVESQLK